MFKAHGFLRDGGFREEEKHSLCMDPECIQLNVCVSLPATEAQAHSPGIVMALRFDTAGLVEEWDAIASVREIVRSSGSIVSEGAEDPNNRKCVEHAELLAPALVRMTQCSLKLPDIEPLRACIAELLEKQKQQVDEAEVDKMAWGVKSMCRFVKMKAKKGLVSFEPCTNSELILLFMGILGHAAHGLSVEDESFQELCLILSPDLEAWATLLIWFIQNSDP